jgi:hypothetical protein
MTDSGLGYQIGQDLMVGLEHGLKREFSDRLVRETRTRTMDSTGQDWDPYSAI